MPPELPPPEEPPLAPDEALTTEGVIKGSIEGDLKVFKGIRYAEAPVGELRFKAPAPPPTFAGVADATQFGAVCAQPASIGTTGEEDCLFANIWAHTDDTVRPVFVFLHGGGGNGAGGSAALLDGAALAESTGMIVVTINRRLGPLGYLAIDELIQESPRGTAGNYGTLDVIAALEWLKVNVEAFNGNPDRIMLAGQSAGGGAVCSVLSAPDAAGLIDSVALQSAGCRRQGVLNSTVGIEPLGEYTVVEHRELVAELGCDAAADVLACLRSKTAAEVVEAGQLVDINFRAIIDGVVAPTGIYDALANNVVGDIPLIIGSNADEAANIFGPSPVADDAAYLAFLDAVFGPPLSDELYALYPTADYASASEAFLTFFSDFMFNCPAEWVAQSAEANAPVYVYHLTRGFDGGIFADRGAVHTIDVVYLFESFDVWNYAPDVAAQAISTAMQKAWSGLASDPGAQPPYLPNGASAWPAYFDAAKQIVEFGDVIEIATEHRRGRCPALRDVLPG